MPNGAETAILHVGAAPTSSWIVQQCLTRNAELWRQSGVHSLPTAILADVVGSGDKLVEDPARFAGVMQSAFADPDVDIVAGSREMLGRALGGPSGSGLHADADAAIQALAEATVRYRRVVVLSVCPPGQFLEAVYVRALATGQASPLSAWLETVDLDNLSWLPLHRRLCEAFGREAVVVHNFRRTKQGHVALLRDFVALMGIDLPDPVAASTTPPGVRLSETGVRLSTAAAPHLNSTKERSALYEFLQQHFSELDGSPGAVLPPAVRRQLSGHYEAEFETLLAANSVNALEGRHR